MTLYEALSRLLDGDLDPDAAAALRARIANEPDVARAWAAINRLPARIADLPHSEPPALIERGRAERPARLRAAPLWIAAALAASLAAFALLPRSAPTLVLGEGTTVVQGRVDVLAGELMIEVDGESRITVEPLAGRLRDGDSEVTMDRTHLLAALVGAAISLTVDSGTAILRAPGKEPVTFTTGETRRLGPAPTPPPPPSTNASDDRIAQLEQELTGLKLQHAFQQAQLNSTNGTVAEFPANLPAAYRPAEFEKKMREALQGNEQVDLLQVNCDEYPCIAILRSSYAGDDWGQKLADLGAAIKVENYGEDASIHEDSALLHGPDGDVRVMAFATSPPGTEDENVSLRRASRVKELFDALGDPDE